MLWIGFGKLLKHKSLHIFPATWRLDCMINIKSNDIGESLDQIKMTSSWLSILTKGYQTGAYLPTSYILIHLAN